MNDAKRNSINFDLGNDPDPGGTVEKRIKIGWTLVGIFFTFSIFKYLMNAFGLTILPQNLTFLDYGKLTAFGVSILSILFWMWFPLQDLNVLRRWVRTGG
jgi:hypothetical protein